MEKSGKLALSGGCAGAINGLFGGGGGMVLLPMLSGYVGMEEENLFPASVAMIFPICVTSLLSSGQAIPWAAALPFLIGGSLGGLAAGLWGQHIPTLWLHRFLGALILWSGVRYLC